MKLLRELYAQGILSEERVNELESQVEKTGRTEEDIILEKNIVPEQSLFELKSKIYNIPLKIVKAKEVDSNVINIIPEEASVNYKMIAISKEGNSIQVAMVYPENTAAKNALRFLSNQENFNYKVFLITPSNFASLLKERKNLSAETRKALEELNKEKGEVFEVLGKKTQTDKLLEEAPIIKMVFVILRHAIEANASDIHIEPQKDKLIVRFRLNGILHTSLSLPLSVHLSILARIKILSGLKIDENRMPQDGRFSAKINNADVDFRVSTFPTLYGEKVELRVLNSTAGKKSFEDLGLEGRSLEVVKEAIKKPFGMILFTGPTGSGKTTTQYAILRTFDKESLNIVTLEDPIEYSIEGVNQSQTKPEIGYTFAHGLRQILRQDPNVIMVGEIRDEETADLAVNAALTGHIVLSTLHTNSSVGVIPRLIDMGVKSFLIPSTLRIIISQRLVRLLCTNCKIKTKPTEKIRNYILSRIKSMPPSTRGQIKIGESFYLYSSKGCEACGLTGYKGRIGLFEVLSMNNEIAELIIKNPLESSILKAARKQGMLTMEQEGILKVLKGQTTIEEVTRATEER